MDAAALSSLQGLQASAAQFERSAAQTVRATTPVRNGSSGPLAAPEGDLVAGVVGQMVAMAGYHANLRSFAAANAMFKRTLDLLA
ncbi:MAG: hypothetical protein JSR60_10605 [Proteobacteria bacterium]|nr:hypothetical protein [Pseudomonadota bacterium]